MSLKKCDSKRSKKITGALLNQTFDINTFIASQEYQVCQRFMMAVNRWNSDKYLFLYNTKTRKENEVSDNGSEIDLTRKVSTTEQRILSLFADETCQKPYNELSRTARITCETTLANAILTIVVSKQQIADHGYNYILNNYKKSDPADRDKAERETLVIDQKNEKL